MKKVKVRSTNKYMRVQLPHSIVKRLGLENINEIGFECKKDKRFIFSERLPYRVKVYTTAQGYKVVTLPYSSIRLFGLENSEYMVFSFNEKNRDFVYSPIEEN